MSTNNLRFNPNTEGDNNSSWISKVGAILLDKEGSDIDRSNALPVVDPDIAYAERLIEATYGDTVSVYAKAKSLIKFGRNPNVGTATTGYTLWSTGVDQANETYVADNVNSIDSISSSSTSDTIQLTVEGHTMTGGDRTFVVQTVTLSGRTRVALTTPLNRATRVYNSNAVNLVGNVYVYQNTAISSGKPTDTTKIHLTVRAGKNQSEKASTSLSSTDYWIITGFRGSVLKKTAGFADVEIQARLAGGVFRQLEDVATSSGSAGIFRFKPYLIIPPNSDIRLIAVADSSGTDVSGSIQGYLASIQ